MAKRKPKFKMIHHSVDVRVSDDVTATVTVYAPDNMSQWKLVRLGAQKLGLMPKRKRRKSK